MDELDRKFGKEPAKLEEALFRSVTKGIGAEFYQYLTEKVNELTVMSKRYTKLENEKYGFYLRKSIWHYILESDFIKRTNLKPRGYAGDSAMMENILKSPSDGIIRKVIATKGVAVEKNQLLIQF